MLNLDLLVLAQLGLWYSWRGIRVNSLSKDSAIIFLETEGEGCYKPEILPLNPRRAPSQSPPPPRPRPRLPRR